jgi:hypothetical protein
LGFLAVAVVVFGIQAVRNVGAADTSQDTGIGLPSPTGTAPAVLFIGDNYTAAGAGITNTFARQSAKAMGWAYLSDAQAGTGFLAAGQQESSDNGPYFSRLDRDKGVFRPDFVVVSGGRNDAAESSARLTQAGTSYLRSVREAFPDARMVIVSPFWVDSRPPSSLTALRDAEQRLAPSLQAAFIDPLGESWITNQNQSQYIGGNRVNPTVEGHAYLARLLTAKLKAITWPAKSASATRSVSTSS